LYFEGKDPSTLLNHLVEKEREERGWKGFDVFFKNLQSLPKVGS
jgi:hypothetical protein